MVSSITLHNKRKQRNRRALKNKSNGKLRLSVFRSSRHIYGQIIDDLNGITITSASSLESEIKKQFKNCGTKEVAKIVGKLLAQKAIKKGIKNKKVFKRGDIIFWRGHVAICLNTRELIHAYGPRKKVIIMPIIKTIKLIEKTANLKVIKIISI